MLRTSTNPKAPIEGLEVGVPLPGSSSFFERLIGVTLLGISVLLFVVRAGMDPIRSHAVRGSLAGMSLIFLVLSQFRLGRSRSFLLRGYFLAVLLVAVTLTVLWSLT